MRGFRNITDTELGDGVAATAIQTAMVISTPGPTRMAARCVLIPRINHYNMQYNSVCSEVYLLFRRQMLFIPYQRVLPEG